MLNKEEFPDFIETKYTEPKDFLQEEENLQEPYSDVLGTTSPELYDDSSLPVQTNLNPKSTISKKGKKKVSKNYQELDIFTIQQNKKIEDKQKTKTKPELPPGLKLEQKTMKDNKIYSLK